MKNINLYDYLEGMALGNSDIKEKFWDKSDEEGLKLLKEYIKNDVPQIPTKIWNSLKDKISGKESKRISTLQAIDHQISILKSKKESLEKDLTKENSQKHVQTSKAIKELEKIKLDLQKK